MMVPLSRRCLGALVTLLVFAMLVHGGVCRMYEVPPTIGIS